MNATEYNALVRAAARNQPLRGVKRNGGGPANHHWKTRVSRLPGDPRQWRCFVGPGAINDRVASITYLRTGDPRGWEMPDDYPGRAAMERLYGREFTAVDRVLTETGDRPHLLLTAPAAGAPGDFEPVPDAEREPFFMTEAMWEKEIHRAVVFATATPQRYTYVENALGFPIRPRLSRFLVAARPRLPALAPGVVGTGGHIALARLFLVRDPARPDLDTIHVQQLCYWSLFTRVIAPNLDIATPLIPTGDLPPAFGVFVAGVEKAILLAFDALADLIAQGARVEFWSV